MEVSTIAAIATPPGHGGIGIIKISGPESINIALSVFRPIGSLNDPNHHSDHRSGSFSPQSRYLYYGNVVDGVSEHVLDEVLFVVMRAPGSYTAEDVVEIQSHAGPVVLKAILRSLIKKGVQLAEPGEFTRRAFLNGRIDLTRAEAVVDIINARSEKAIDMAMAQISGELNLVIQSLRSTLLDILTYVEAAIDFPGEVGGDIDIKLLAERLEDEIITKVVKLIDRCDDQNFLREGLKIVIVGGPNVGKSSLMNRLLDKERSIVTDIPGTTRDFIEDSFIASGVPIVLTDTAGIHDNPDTVEQIGIEKAWDYITGADIILYTVDAGNPVSKNDLDLFKNLRSKKIIIVINKIDLPAEQICFELPAEWRHIDSIRISALYNQGIDELKGLIAETACNTSPNLEERIVPNLRHKLSLEKALLSLITAKEGLCQSLPLELISIDLKVSLDALSEITGEGVRPDILDNIFSRFCIGK
ncbi:MAG: tRNA uridine-5-carboxymethylaminomethyl(34) synthesis GTPase MnmE [Desulfobacteraceae bacterium]|nr:tRNA uridine-5-carboxymethylaminomethyl(34) synthesis GTPase MnmE [Desulfobacteraceae bacterium]MBC2757038.1 tRNA uridine-5-carboxymethylaminomethyl(34) synthesis GTPase MnmE [Desulfobacteraceae bacterium]